MLARKRLGELLVEDGTLDETQLRAALGHQRQWGGKLGETVVELKLASERQVLPALSRRLGCEVARLDGLQVGPELHAALKLVPAELARRHQVVPLSATRTAITIAMADPGNVLAVDEISFRVGRRVKVLLAGAREVARTVQRLYGAGGRDDAIAVDFDVHADVPEDPRPYDASPARFQERFYETSLRDWRSDAAAQPPPGPHLVRSGPPAPAGARANGATATPHGDGVVEALRQMSAAGEVSALPADALVGAVVAVLLRRGFITQSELVAELWRTRNAPRAERAEGDDAS
jgi:type IV pilus assembly protein PilB